MINLKSIYPFGLNVVVMPAKTFLTDSNSQGLQDKLKTLFGQTILLKIVVPRTRSLVGTAPPRVGSGQSRAGTVGTTKGGSDSTSTGSTPKVRIWVWRVKQSASKSLESDLC